MSGKYRTIVADPPWPYGETMGRSFGEKHSQGGRRVERRVPLSFDEMDLTAIRELSIGALADDNAHLFTWTTQRHLEATFGIVRAWGFSPSCTLTWCKAPHGWGPGGVFQSTTEFVVYARRGKPDPSTHTVDRQWWGWPRGRHSAKSEAFLDLIEQHFPAPYLELFARRARFGWDYWGDESLGTAEMPVA